MNILDSGFRSTYLYIYIYIIVKTGDVGDDRQEWDADQPRQLPS